MELYDLRSDLGETHDLAAAHPEVVDRLLLDLDAWMTSTDADLSIDAATGLPVERPASLARSSGE